MTLEVEKSTLRGLRTLNMKTAVLLFVWILSSSAQEKTTQAVKKEPEPRSTTMPVQQTGETLTAAGKQPGLPKFDLPEFIITGTASNALPDAEKLEAGDSGVSEIPAMRAQAERGRETVELAARVRERIDENIQAPLSGKLSASIGSFFSPQVDLLVGGIVPDYQYTLQAHYDRMKGFAPHTDRSGGDVRAEGAMPFQANLWFMNRGLLSGSVMARSESFKFYGSRNPESGRSIFSAGVLVGVENSRWNQYPSAFSLGLRSFSVADSSVTAAESQLDVGWRSSFPLSALRMYVEADASVGSVTGSGSGNLSHVRLTLGTETRRWDALSVNGSLNFYSAAGMDGQSILKVYPHIEAGYELTNAHRIRASYAPTVQASSLRAQTESNPYLSSDAAIRHADISQAVAAALESEWAYAVRSKFSVKFESGLDRPLYTDSLSAGIWRLAYAGRTSVLRFKAEMFANVTVNDYFSSGITVYSSTNSATGEPVPYLPAMEAGFFYRHSFAYGISVEPSLKFFLDRRTDIVGSRTLPGAILLDVRSEFQPFEQTRVFLEFRNLMNQNYKIWEGYQALPFTMSAGLSFTW